MTADGTLRLLQDLKLQPDSRLVLIMVWKMRAATQCEFSKEEFQNGLLELGSVYLHLVDFKVITRFNRLFNWGFKYNMDRVDSIDKLRSKLPSVEADTLRDVVKFRDLYIFSFAYAKNPNQKGIELDMAIPYWHILLQGRFPLLNLWTQFLQVFTI